MRMTGRSGVGLFVALMIGVVGCAPTSRLTESTVRGWTETVVIPTYPVGPTSDVPEFVQTGAREIYPYAEQQDLSFESCDQGYKAYKLENEYVRIEVLPAIGGRLFALYDRVTGQDILYRQVSIKPARIGLRGAWISGGIEWNFPDGHIVTTHDQVSCQLVRHEDGSASIVVGDTERIFRMSWTVELRLRPGRAFVETRIICRNRTPVRHRASWWSNAGFPATEQTQFIFPVWKTTGHGGHSLADWPIHRGRDVSWYKAHEGATSIFRAAGQEDFMAAYDHGRDVGLAQYADREVMPGRKFWSWGVNDAGMRWAKILSDDNRSYVEVQSGEPLTQGEWFYIQPHEEKQYLEYWMPVTRIGPPTRINPDAVVRLTIEDGVATVGVLPTGRIDPARIELWVGQALIKRWQRTISPADVFMDTCALNGASPDDVWLRVFDVSGREVVAHRYGHYSRGDKPLLEPEPWRGRWEVPEAKDADQAVQLAQRDELRGNLPASIDRLTKGFEGFPRDAGIRLALGIARIKQGLSADARQLLAEIPPSPSDEVAADVVGYYLGVALARCGEFGAAMSQFDAVRHDRDLRDAAVIEGAKLLLKSARWQQAIARLGPLTAGPQPHTSAEVYTAIALRKLGQTDQARRHILRAMERDSLDLVAQVELAVLHEQRLGGLPAVRDEQRRIEAATAYMELGLYEMAERLLRPDADSAGSATASYLRASVAELAGDPTEASRLHQQAARAPLRGDMPSRLEELGAFEAALRANPDDTNAHYLAGLVLYSKDRQSEAVDHWRRAIELGHEDAMVYRCLGAAVAGEQPKEAASYFRQALDRDGRVVEFYVDLDEICQELGNLPSRIEALERGVRMLPERDTLAHRLGEAYFDAGRYGDAVETYLSRRFHITEGRYELHDHYAAALLGRAMVHYQAGRRQPALADLDAALEYPDNLNIGRPTRERGAGSIHYWRGRVLKDLGQPEQAAHAWRRAAEGGYLGHWVEPWSPGRAVAVVHAIWARQALGQNDEADELQERLHEACDRYEKIWPPHGQAFAMLIRGLIAAGDGRLDEARQMLNAAEAGSKRMSGYVRLLRVCASLLAAHSSSRPAQAVTPPVATVGGG